MDNKTPVVALNVQYIKDLSLEIPHAPQIFSKLTTAPKISVDLNIDAKKIEDTQFEVTLNVRINADINSGIASHLFQDFFDFCSGFTRFAELNSVENAVFHWYGNALVIHNENASVKVF